MGNSLDRSFEYYVLHQPELVEKFSGRYLVIVGEAVVGDYEDRESALNAAAAGYKPGEFLIQQCTPGDSAYTRRYYSRRIKFNG